MSEATTQPWGRPAVGADVSMPRLALSVAEAARAVGVSERTMNDLLTGGTLPSVKFGSRRLVPVGPLQRRLAELAESDRRAGQDHGGGGAADRGEGRP
ncbi:MAG: helix-turn-helix domain-containing protein [Planctomycetota bacterium]